MQTKFIRNRVYNYSHCLGPGIREGRGFSRPTDFALGPDNIIYLASRGVEFATFGGGTDQGRLLAGQAPGYLGVPRPRGWGRLLPLAHVYCPGQ